MLDAERHGERAHPDAGHRRVADVDEVDPGCLQEAGGLDRALDADRARRVDLDRDDEATAGEGAGEGVGGRRARRRRVAGGTWRGRSRRRVGLGARPGGVGLHGRSRRQRVEGTPHGRDVLRASCRNSHRRSPRRRPGSAAPSRRGRPGSRRRRTGPRSAGAARRLAGSNGPVVSPGAAAIASSASAHASGPPPQLTPTTSAPAATSAAAAIAGRVPSGSASSSPNVSWATIGRSAARRASSTASRRWSRSENVSKMKRSTPPSSRPSSCSRTAARISESGRCSSSRVGAPSGPIEPATQASRPATSRASRASWAPRRLSARRPVAHPVRRKPDPVGAERRGLDQFGAGREVLAVDRADELRAGGDELVEVGPLGDAARVEEGAHRAIGQQRPGGKPGPEPIALVHGARP